MIQANVNYNGQRGAVNCTVHPVERQKAIADEKKAIADQVASNQEYQRVPKGERKLKHTLVEDVHKNGGDEKVKTETTTKRRNH